MQTQRLHLTIHGAVQGVGFRPFVYRLAIELGLVGWVNNSSEGVFIEVEGTHPTLELFLQRLQQEKPPRSQIQSLEVKRLVPIGYTKFEIRQSVSGEKTAVVLPDLALCSECLQEILSPNNRRYHYPFTNCTNCGPRYSIIEELPYDRCNTTMKGFPMCPECQLEYENPLDRRFHAQPNACPICGPNIELWDTQGNILATYDRALLATAKAIREGKIVAVKGLGGFHLMVDGRNPRAVNELRQRKRRSEKPFAVMYPSLELLKLHCEVTPLEEELLLSPEAPIVLVKRKLPQLPETVAPGNPYLGVMLPYTPLHHLLMNELGFPVVATSGNLSDEPLCIDNQDALARLRHIADVFLWHNRPIARPVDDSVVRVMGGRAMVLRRARGYAPFPLLLKTHRQADRPRKTDDELFPSLRPSFLLPHFSYLAVGAHLKNTIAIAYQHQIFISQHIGDLENSVAFASFLNVLNSLQQLYELSPAIIACDLHPDYLSTQYALQQGLPVVRVQHHHAHVLSCMADNQIEAPVLGIAWDGTGYGTDGTIWGGEFIHVTPHSWQRIAHFRTFKLPGGEKAIKEPRRVALGLLYEIFGHWDLIQDREIFSPQELGIIKTMLSRNLNTPTTSSVGRLFDGVASLIGIRHKASFEGQAAMELEFAIAENPSNETYPFEIIPGVPAQINWESIIKGILQDLTQNIAKRDISVKFHNTLVEIIIEIAKRVGEKQVVLTGGCFQNRYLTEKAIARLREENFEPYWHKNIPPNDGGIALGQIMEALIKGG